MRRCAFVLIPVVASAIYSAQLSAQSEKINLVAEKETTEIPIEFRQQTWAAWSGGALLVIEDRFTNSPRIHVIDREGKDTSQFFLTILDGGGFLVGDWGLARGSDGVIAVVGIANFPEQRSGFLAIVSPNGSTQKYIPLTPYRPDSVTIAPDGTIWVIESIRASRDTKYHDESLMALYNQNGELLRSFVPLPETESERHFHPTLNSVLMASKDRVALYSKTTHTYSEFAFDGRLIARIASWPSLDEHPMDWPVLCDDGRVFAAEQINGSSTREGRWGIFALDRKSGTWNFAPSKHLVKLFGCDGTRLASTSDLRSVSWLPQTN